MILVSGAGGPGFNSRSAPSFSWPTRALRAALPSFTCKNARQKTKRFNIYFTIYIIRHFTGVAFVLSNSSLSKIGKAASLIYMHRRVSLVPAAYLPVHVRPDRAARHAQALVCAAPMRLATVERLSVVLTTA